MKKNEAMQRQEVPAYHFKHGDQGRPHLEEAR